MTVFDRLIADLHKGKNPYTSFPASEWRGAWYGDPGAAREIFSASIDQTAPGVIIEVGSFVGESAIHMAKTIKAKQIDAAILCIDTWYGGFDHYVGAPEKINMHFGRSDLFYRFIANVIENGCQDVIVPFAMDSTNAARVLQRLGISARLIYVDASHEEGDVLRDFESYWPLVQSGGGLLADDLSNHFPGCVHDWKQFTEKYNLSPTRTEGEKALVIKP